LCFWFIAIGAALGALVLVGLVSLLRGHHYPRSRHRYVRRRSYR
jgi:hypothetical protein